MIFVLYQKRVRKGDMVQGPSLRQRAACEGRPHTPRGAVRAATDAMGTGVPSTQGAVGIGARRIAPSWQGLQMPGHFRSQPRNESTGRLRSRPVPVHFLQSRTKGMMTLVGDKDKGTVATGQGGTRACLRLPFPRK